MVNINTILIDDEIEALDTLEILLSEYSEIKIIQKISKPIDFFPSLMNNDIDLVFLDIKMPVINGLELLEKIRECKPSLPVVIVSAYDDYAMAAAKNNVFSYLLKPIRRSELKSTINQVVRYLDSQRHEGCQKILVNSNSHTIILDVSQIVFLRADGSYTNIYMDNGDVHFVSNNIGNLREKFTQPNFVRLSRSIIGNRDYISSINRKNKLCSLKFSDKEITVKVSSTFLSEVNVIFNYG